MFLNNFKCIDAAHNVRNRCLQITLCASVHDRSHWISLVQFCLVFPVPGMLISATSRLLWVTLSSRAENPIMYLFSLKFALKVRNMQGVVVQRTVFPKKKCLKRFSPSAFQTFLFWKIEDEIEGRAPVSRYLNDILSPIIKALSFCFYRRLSCATSLACRKLPR